MIRVEGLCKNYAGAEVLRGVNLDVQRGQATVVVGASGGGKSTLLRCINALEPFDSGAVHVADLTLSPGENGESSNGVYAALRRRVGMVFQQFNLFPHFTALENVMSGPQYALGLPREEAADRAKKLLDRVGLGDKLHHKPAALSGGQQQRVAIARALANEPEAILFDEPTSALDPRMTAEVLAVMADLAAGGQTMLVVSHAMGFVRRSAHQVHVMAEGRVIESGPPEQIFESPEHPQTREFLAEACCT
ncbi:MAG TPA: amino acid ABC transporter ATP-binding protein [Phycisphaerae bacterium]|nr:amino acid ABC transporter ATP-binding protein [Phycisphaerae bacterium]